jgi:hypothetical protein
MIRINTPCSPILSRTYVYLLLSLIRVVFDTFIIEIDNIGDIVSLDTENIKNQILNNEKIGKRNESSIYSAATGHTK